MDVDQSLALTQRILIGDALKKYKTLLLECKQSAKDIAEDKGTLGKLKELSTNYLCTWDKSDGLAYNEDACLVLEKCVNFKKDIWLDLVKAVWRNHRIIFQDHLKYIFNDIVKPLFVGTLHFADTVQDMHDLSNHLPPPSIKGGGYEPANWKFCNK